MIFALTDCVLSCVPATPDLALILERLLPVGCGPQGDQKSQACRHGGGEGPSEHVPVQPAPGRGEEGGGEPAGQVQSVPRYGDKEPVNH